MSLKVCATCKNKKDETSFSWKDKKKGFRHYVCSECHSIYRKKHYEKNKQKYIDKARKWNEEQKVKLQKILFEYLTEHPCVDCGESDVVVLDFDHQSDKHLPLSTMFKHRYSVKKVLAEIEKCEVRCANCHRKRTAKEKGYWKIGFEI